jgi:hypothetical protein
MDSGLDAGSGPNQVTTHGICESCASEVLADLDTMELSLPEPGPERVLMPVTAPLKPEDTPRPR